MNLEIKPDGFTLEATGLEWLVQNVDEFCVGVFPDGSLLVVEADAADPFMDGAAAAHYRDFDDLYSENNGFVALLPNYLLRQVAHALGISEIKGHPVEEYFPDDDEEDDEDEPPLAGVKGKLRLVEPRP